MMDKKGTYDILRELFEDNFSDTSVRLSSELLGEILKATSVELVKIAEEIKLSKNELSDFRLECIEIITEMHFRDGLNDDFTSLLLKNESVEFREHLAFLREMDAGIHYAERKQKLEEFKKLESSIEDREIEATVTLQERKKLLNKFNEIEAKISPGASEVSASESKMYSESMMHDEIPAAASRIASNRSMFIRIAAILVLVLIPTSIIIFLIPNSSTPTNENSVQTAQKEESDTDADVVEDLLMGSSPNFSMDWDIPNSEVQEMFLQISNNDDSFGFAEESDSVLIRFVSYDNEIDYLFDMKINIRYRIMEIEIMEIEIMEIDSLSEVEMGSGRGSRFNTLNDEKVKLLEQQELLDSIDRYYYDLSNTYKYKNNQLVITFHHSYKYRGFCGRPAAFDSENDKMELFKDDGNLFLKINDNKVYPIRPGSHKLKPMSNHDSDGLPH